MGGGGLLVPGGGLCIMVRHSSPVKKNSLSNVSHIWQRFSHRAGFSYHHVSARVQIAMDYHADQGILRFLAQRQ
jgi:hypothetical protein